MRFPLTRVQTAYLMGRNEAFESSGVSTHAYYEFKNKIDIQRYEIALNKVIERHEMLRAVIYSDGTQEILKEVPYYRIKVKDLQQESPEKVQTYIKERREEMSHHVFQEEQWPMFQIEAARLKDNETYLFISCDLLIADGSSLKMFLRETVDYYTNLQIEKAPLEMQFRDYILSAEKKKQGLKYKKDKEYWMNQIEEFPTAPVLPVKKGDAGKNIFKRLEKRLPIESWKKLKQLAEQRGVTPAIALFTAYASVLENFSHQDSFAINVTLSNRGKMQGKLKNVIGDFTSLLLMPVDTRTLSGEFWERTLQIQKKFMECYKHTSYDGVDFEHELANYHNWKEQALYPVVFTSMMGAENEVRMQPLLGEMQYSISQTSQVYLDFQMIPIRDEVMLTWDYSTQKYETKLLENMFDQFSRLVDTILLRERIMLKDIRQLQKQDMEIISEYNNSKVGRTYHTLQEMWECTLRQYGNRPALKDDKECITYMELEERSDHVASYLQRQGVHAGHYVGVEGLRKIDTVVKIIGIVKTGAAYVAIDPEYPEERKNYILHHCDCKVFLSGDMDIEAGHFSPGMEHRALPKQDAYVIYTSGSTGEPKGVVITNDAVTNTIEDMNQRFCVTCEDVILGVSSYCFDLSVYDIFGSISAGALHRIARDARDIDDLKECVEQDGVTVWNSVPAIFQLLLENYQMQEENNLLKKVFLSGDWIPMQLKEKMEENFCQAELFSLGGATEASIWSIYYPVREVKQEWSSIPYGYPLGNQKCYVLDKDYEFCQFEVPGEICIGGAGVAKEYRKSEELTDRAFIQHPVLGRLYKTGDLGIFRRAGYIDILGRIDHQVKVNGFRIETGEIESAAEKNELIEKAVVTVSGAERSKELNLYIKAKTRKEYVKGNAKEHIIEAAFQKSLATEEWKQEVRRETAEEADQFAIQVMQYYIYRVLGQTVRPCNVTVEEMLSIGNVRPVYKKILKVWLDLLCEKKYSEKKGDIYSIPETWTVSLEQILQRLDELEKKNQCSLGFLRDCILNIQDILTGKSNAVTFLFPNGGLENADGIYKENSISKYFNGIVATAVAKCQEENIEKEDFSILEVGAGVGGTTEPLVEMLKEKNLTYTFTDISDFFTKEAKKKFHEKSYMEYGNYNIDEMPQKQNMKLESRDVILAANVMHDAKNIDKSVAYVSDMLKPDGMFVVLEMTKDTLMQLISTRLIEGYSNYEDFRLIKNSPLLSEDEWKEVLSRNGFSMVKTFPEKGAFTMDLGEHVILAFKEKKRTYLKEVELYELRKELLQKLPKYMVPNQVMQLPEIPLSANGKVERRKLPEIPKQAGKSETRRKPETQLQKDVYEIFCNNFEHQDFGIEDSFFHVGGDSIIMLKIVAQIKEKFQLNYSFQEFMADATIEKIADTLEKKIKEARKEGNVK